MNEFKVTPLFGMHASAVTPAGELAGGPEGAGNAKIISRENACRDNGRNGDQNLTR
jgi:hypothetical protein